MYDFYIYASYTFTAFALGAIIVVSLHGLARARQRLAALQDMQKWRWLKTIALAPLAAHAGGFRVFRTVLCGPICRRSDAASLCPDRTKSA